MSSERFLQQIHFVMEVDRVKNILRQSIISDRSRRENDAEHSWHLCVMAIVLYEYAEDPNINLLNVLKMLLIHDIVEIDSGDTFAYDEIANRDKDERELKAAKRIFGLLPDDQRQEMMELWFEFEKRETADAKFANALDRLQPIMLNYYTEGYSWKKHGITSEQVYQRNASIADGSEKLSMFMKEIVEQAVIKGYLQK